MDDQRARTKWEALRRMTVARGCTVHEAATAKRLADVLAKKYGFADAPPKTEWRGDFYTRYAKAEKAAVHRWHWETRRCGSDRCSCMHGGPPHGPYKYGKVRRGKKVSSVYVGH